MKCFLTTLLFVFGILKSYGQTVTYDDFRSLIPYLQKEEWKPAFEESSKLLQSAEKDTSEFKAIVLYINIFSAAGMVTEGKMTYDKLEKNIMRHKGQKIIMSAHPVTTRDGALGQTKFTISDTANEAFTAATNAKGINILCFEKFLLKDKIDLTEFPDRSFVRCGGTLEKIETNPNKSLIWILRLTVKEAFARRTK